MTDDIVTRLRAEICECGYSESFKELHKCLNCEAADEIERLRAENHGLRIKVFILLKKLEEKSWM
jgi:hypothetical protein